jgi:VanZ like family
MIGAGASLGRWLARRAWLPWGAAILFLSVAPPGWILGAVPRGGWSLASSAGHVCEFGLLALLVWLALPAGVSGVASLAFGLVIELVQWPIPYRSFDLWDWVADAGGIATVLLVLSACRRHRAVALSRHR